MIWLLPVWILITATWYMLGRAHGRRAAERDALVRTVETIEDTEGNLHYKIELGKKRCDKKHEHWFWRLEADRKGPSAITGDMSLDGMPFQIEGLPDGAEILVGGMAMGGPHDTKDEALAEALQALEHVR